MRRTILLLSTVASTWPVASGLTLAAGVRPAASDSLVVGPGGTKMPGSTPPTRAVTIVVLWSSPRGRGDPQGRDRAARAIDDRVIEAPARGRLSSHRACCTQRRSASSLTLTPTAERTGPRVKDVSVSGLHDPGLRRWAGPDGDAFVFQLPQHPNATTRETGSRKRRRRGRLSVGASTPLFVNNKVVGDPRNTTNGLDVEAGSRNTLFANNVVRGYDAGIAVDETVDTTIEGNDVIDAFAGIGTTDTTGTKIRSNVVSRSGIVGVFVRGPKSQDAKIVGNNISGGAFGMYVFDTKGGGSFAGNTIRNNCAGMFFEAFPSEPVGGFEVKANTVEDNTRSCRAAQFDRNFSGIGIALLGASGMEVTGNHLSGNVPSGPTAVSGGIVVATDPFFGGTTKPRNNSVTGNHFGRNKPDIFWDKSGSGNSFDGNLCNTSVPGSLCN